MYRYTKQSERVTGFVSLQKKSKALPQPKPLKRENYRKTAEQLKTTHTHTHTHTKCVNL